MYTVYKHTAPNGKCYIGMTKQLPNDRWKNGLGYRTQTRFYRAILKHGWDNMSHEIISSDLTFEQAEELEKTLIAKYRSWDKNFGYNIERGGNCKKGISAETLAKIKKSHSMDEYKAKIREANARRWSKPEARTHMSMLFSGERNPQYGKKLSEGHKRVLIEARRKVKEPRDGVNNNFYGKHHSEETKQKISQANFGVNSGKATSVMCVETGEIFGCIRDAYRATNIHFSSISKCCVGKARSAGGYHWQYVEMEV